MKDLLILNSIVFAGIFGFFMWSIKSTWSTSNIYHTISRDIADLKLRMDRAGTRQSDLATEVQSIIYDIIELKDDIKYIKERLKSN